MSTRQQSTRRTVLRTIGSLGLASVAAAATASADSDDDESTPPADADGARSRPATTGCEPVDVDQYIATVDRIVDGRFVVLLLEEDGELVDQHVAPRSTLETVDEDDILRVVIKNDEILVAQQLPRRPGRSATDPTPQGRFDSLASDADAA